MEQNRPQNAGAVAPGAEAAGGNGGSHIISNPKTFCNLCIVSDGAAGNNLNEIRQSLTSVVDALRDFLSDIRVLTNDADVDDDESDENDHVPNDDSLT
jgi:hypothetical protein